jgi:hypothetical protein
VNISCDVYKIIFKINIEWFNQKKPYVLVWNWIQTKVQAKEDIEKEKEKQ